MKRLIDYHLKNWKKSAARKPLLIRGARQVGKTHVIRKFSQSFKNIVIFGVEEKKAAKQRSTISMNTAGKSSQLKSKVELEEN